jgi:hypothetical protein
MIEFRSPKVFLLLANQQNILFICTPYKEQNAKNIAPHNPRCEQCGEN